MEFARQPFSIKLFGRQQFLSCNLQIRNCVSWNLQVRNVLSCNFPGSGVLLCNFWEINLLLCNLFATGFLLDSWIEICKVAVFHRVISTIGASDHEVCKGLRKSETWDLGTRCRTQRLKLCPRTRKYSSYCHIQTIILGLVHCVEHKAGIIFQKETIFGQSLAFKLITFKKTTAKLIPYNMKIA